MSSEQTTDENIGVENEVALPPPKMQQTGAERQFQMFMDPMFAELQKTVKEHERILDEMNEKMNAEKLQKRKEREQAHIPEKLRGTGQDLNDVMKAVENMMLYEIDDDTEQTGAEDAETKQHIDNKEQKPEVQKKRITVRKLDAIGNAAVTSHSLAAYVSCLEEDHLRKFMKMVTADCQLWLAKMFRFDEASASYHEDQREGLVRVCRLALYQKYPKYVTDGFEALYSRPPVIYLSSATPPGLSNYLCLQLGLPISSVCTVPCNTLFGSSTKMDIEILEKLIEDDIAAAKTPVALMAYAGTPTVGHVDELEKIQELCKKNNIWMHVEGSNLSTLALIQPPTDVRDAKFGDSISISLGRWLGIPALPHATLFKSSDPTLVHASSLNTFNPALKLHCLPLWVILQSLGIEGINERILFSCELAEKMFKELEPFKSIKQISRVEDKTKDKTIKSISDLISRALTALLVFEMVTPTVVFRYSEDEEELANVAVAPYAVGSGLDENEEQDEERNRKMEYYNALNAWLADSLQADNPNVEVSTIDVEREGICIRYAPLESAQVYGTTEEHIEAFTKSLVTQIAILDATVLNYEKFRMIVADEENLQIVEVSKWAGLGAVQYIPNEYLECLDSLTPKGVQEINNLNIELVHKLKSTDMAFSLGRTDGDMACVKFGLITEETDVGELIGTVQSVGKEVQESSKYMESMSELIRKGIEEANKDLEEENQNKLVQEGVLRQIPMIGSMFNWLSPTPKNQVKGRTFNLLSGTIVSTEETYKYKMQIQADQADQASPVSTPRSRQVSESGSVSSQQSPPPPASPTPSTKSAGDVKAHLLNSVNEGDLTETQEALPSPNGNLSLNLDGNEVETKQNS